VGFIANLMIRPVDQRFHVSRSAEARQPSFEVAKEAS
jgi:hypothetical protein